MRFPSRGQPKPANVVGGQGQGAVGGQTLCGLYFLEQLANAQNLAVAFWPFDGIDLNGPGYAGRHVGFEIYPDGVRPQVLTKSDLNDALSAGLWMAERDRDGELASVLQESVLDAQRSTVRVEGWIAGAGLGPEYALTMPAGPSVSREVVANSSRQIVSSGRGRETTPELRSGSAKTTQIGVVNRNGQKCLGTYGRPGNHSNQMAYKTQCLECGHVYGANGADLHLRRCPGHDSGAPGLDY